ncbi:hypothetical protein GMST_10810 [Geomonas silvestris]|uniref:Uncharacterized protein n=1 Tax=Geomonas silvestris TaxID=2740184 RepID=A0A6V8MFI6_9BACT|nr:hypothetical protein GMST_10810 [Geomonas silvestris]
MIDGKKVSAHIHEHWMEGVVESEAYRMTSYQVAVDNGIPKETAARLYLLPGDKEYVF